MGKTRTINKIKDRFMWKGMVKDVQDMVSVVDVDTRLIFAFLFCVLDNSRTVRPIATKLNGKNRLEKGG